MVAQAFASANPLGCELKVMLGSDLSHPDTPDLDAIVPNAFRLVQEGLVREDQFRRFMVDNAVDCFTRMSPHFFDGTTVTSESPPQPGPGAGAVTR